MPDRPDPVLKRGPKFVKRPKSSPQENTATIFAANTITIVSSSFAHPSAQKDALALLTHLVSVVIGLVAGLFTGKQL